MDNNNLLLKKRRAFANETSTNGSSSIDQFRTISSDNDADVEEEIEIKTLTDAGVGDSRGSLSFRSSPTVLYFPSNSYQRQRKEVIFLFFNTKNI